MEKTPRDKAPKHCSKWGLCKTPCGERTVVDAQSETVLSAVAPIDDEDQLMFLLGVPGDLEARVQAVPPDPGAP